MAPVYVYFKKLRIQHVWLLVLLAGLDGIAANEISISASGYNSTNVIENTSSRLRVRNTIGSFSTLFLTTEKGSFVELQMNSYSKSNTIGSPQLPILSKLIEIPTGSIPEVNVISYEVKEYKLSDFGITQKMLPVQPPVAKNNSRIQPFELNKNVYETNSFYGEALARIEVAGYLREVQLANLILSPIEYNPVKNTIRVYDNLVVEILFKGANRIKSSEKNAKTYSPYFNRYLSNILNYQPDNAINEPSNPIPVKYVIVSDAMFRDALRPFVEWKIKRGFNVIEAYTSDPAVGTTLSSIKAYLQFLYSSATVADPAPTFVLFVGDVAQIPAFACGDHVSDLYYCEYTGDYLPEVFYGRFSANTVAELLPQIKKTLQYEQYRMPDPTFLKNVVLAAGADATHQARWSNGQVNYGNRYYFNEAHNLVSHTYLQPEPEGSNFSKNIQDNISNGVSYANYSAHGNQEGWADPTFTISQIALLQNVDKYGLLVGNSCQTNAFDQNSFGEALLRAENKGALGYIGASGLSYWNEDYWWSVGSGSIVSNPTYEATGAGAYDRIFHDQGEPRSEWCSTMGQMLFAGNLAVQESNSVIKKHYWESYCLMGDPSTMIYFGQPPPIAVEYMPLLPLGLSTLDVRTEPFASVAISKNKKLYGVAEADENGLALIPLQPFTETGYANVVVTKQNRQPYIDSICVTTPERPYLVLKKIIIKDSGGNNNRMPEAGETLSINILINNLGNSEAKKAVSRLSTNDSYVAVSNPINYWPSIAGSSSSFAANAFTLEVSEDVPDMHIASFTVATETDSGTFRSDFKVQVFAPKLTNGIFTIDDTKAGNGNGQIDPGETLVVTMPTSNTGHSGSGEVTSQLFSFGNNFTIKSESLNLGNLTPGETTTSMFSFTVKPDALPGSKLSLFMIAKDNQYNSVSHLNLIIGSQVEDFETGNFQKNSWHFKGNKPWVTSFSEKSEGSLSARSGSVNHSEQSEMYLEGQVLFEDTLSFYRKVSSENGYDFLKLYIDGFKSESWSGSKEWEKVSFPVSAGKHRFSWVYEKDEATTAGLDAAWIDDIKLPAFSQESADSLTINAIAVPDTLCYGEQTQLFAFASGGSGEYTYCWTPSPKLRNSGVFNPYVSSLETSTFGVSVNSGSLSAKSKVTVTIEQTAAAPVITQSGNHLVSSSIDGNQWYNSQGLLPGATLQEYFPTTSNTYYAITKIKGCPSNPSNEIMFTLTGIETFKENELSVYPNPFISGVNLEYTTKTAGYVNIMIYNSTGKKIRTIEEGEKTAGTHNAFFDGSLLSPGIYSCVLNCGKSVQFTRVIKN